MSNATVRINRETHQALRDLADKTGSPMQKVLKDAVELYRRQKFLDEMNAGFEALKANPAEWTKELQERMLWDKTSGDGQSEKE